MNRFAIVVGLFLVFSFSALSDDNDVVSYIPDRSFNEVLAAFYKEFPRKADTDVFELDYRTLDDEKRNEYLNKLENLPVDTFHLGFTSANMPESPEVSRIDTFLGVGAEGTGFSCLVNMELSVYTANDIEDEIVMNVCDERVEEIKELVDKSWALASEAAKQTDPVQLDTSSKEFENGAKSYFFPVLIVGHGIAALNTFAAVSDDRVAIVQIREQRGCENSSHLAYCSKFKEGMLNIAAALLDIDYTLDLDLEHFMLN